MQKPKISLEPSEGILVQAAAGIYSAYISSGQVSKGKENDWMKKSIREAITIAQMTDLAVQSDSEMG